jgi:hypothetical protein
MKQKDVKKFDPKKAKKELDKLWSLFIRNRDRTCRKCGKTGSTQAAHIFGRGNLSTRWDAANGIGLCFYCHIYWAHRQPVEFTLWITEELGKAEFDRLKKKARILYDSSNLKKDYEVLRESLLAHF